MPIITEPTPDVLSDLIRRAVERETENIVASEATEAARRVEKRIRAKTAEICATVLRRMNMEWSGNQLRITVDFNNTHA